MLRVLDKDDIDYQIITYVLAHISQIESMTVRQLAKEIYVSPSAIIRFINRIGIEDFKTFKQMLKKDEEYELETVNHHKYEDIQSDLNKVNFQGLFKKIDEVLKEVKNAEKICIYCDAPYWYEVGLVERKIEKVINISQYSEKEKIEILETLTENDVLINVFPKWNYIHFMMALHEFEPKFRTTLDGLKCKQYFMGQKIANYLEDYKLIEVPYFYNYSVYRILLTMTTDYILSNY